MDKNLHLTGLNDAEVEESRRRYGSNILTPPERIPWWREFLEKFRDPLIIILMVAGLLSIGISFYEYFGLAQGWKVFFEPIGIFVAILLATGLAFIFEHNANKAFRLLNAVNDDEPVEVVRNANTTTIPRKDIVVGDVVILNTGDEVPADGRLVDAVTLSVDESSLTGEPVCHKTTSPEGMDSDATYPSDYVLRGTKVMEGHAVMEVDRVGDATEMGKVMVDVQIDSSVRTPLAEQLDRLAAKITDFSYTVAALVIIGQLIHYFGWTAWAAYSLIVPVAVFFWLVIKRFPVWTGSAGREKVSAHGKTKVVVSIVAFFIAFFALVILVNSFLHPGSDSKSWSMLLSHTLTALMVAVTLIVVAVPEGLPMAVTLALATSMSRMLKTNNLVRKMHACETMGAATVICTDKTGTLTRNLMQVSDTRFFGSPDPRLVNEAVAVNSTATLDLSGPSPRPLGNPTEGALLIWLRDRGADYSQLREDAPRIAELPFSTERKLMATIVRSAVNGRLMLYVKGAPEIVMGLCTPRDDNDAIVAELAGWQRKAMRTLAFAYMPLEDAGSVIADGRLNATGLTLLGIAAISDPVRDDVPAAVSECMNAGIKIKIVTGDTPATAGEIGRRIGLWNGDDSSRNIITGPDFAALTDEELDSRIEDIKIIARARPSDKRRLVEALQKRGEVVAVTGDGTNDAPALRQAHVGLSMGDGTSVAKEASDITIIDNSFSSIGRAVMWGRSLYKNIRRFLLFQLTVNVAACLLVLLGSFFGSESPLTVTQMLWVNLIMDTFGAMALASLPPSRSVMADKPRRRSGSILTGAMDREIIGVGVLFFLITFLLYLLFNHADITSLPGILHASIGEARGMTPYEATLLFSVFVWTHFWYMFDARAFDTARSIFRLPMSSGFWTIVAVIVVGQLAITEVAYDFFNVEPMLHTPDWRFNPSGALDLAIIVAGSSLVVWAREAWRLLVPASPRRR